MNTLKADSGRMTARQSDITKRLVDLSGRPSSLTKAKVMQAVHSEPIQARAHLLHPSLRLAIAGAAACLTVGSGTAVALAASVDAVPTSPVYFLRLAGEHLRIAVAQPNLQEQLRIDFARTRTSQAAVAQSINDRVNADGLLVDSRRYLQEASAGLSSVPAGLRSDLQRDLDQVTQREVLLASQDISSASSK